MYRRPFEDTSVKIQAPPVLTESNKSRREVGREGRRAGRGEEREKKEGKRREGRKEAERERERPYQCCSTSEKELTFSVVKGMSAQMANSLNMVPIFALARKLRAKLCANTKTN